MQKILLQVTNYKTDKHVKNGLTRDRNVDLSNFATLISPVILATEKDKERNRYRY